jgi:hypothetical protein
MFSGRDQNTNVPSLEKVLGELAEEVKCPLCLGYFNQPVALGCFHTFCTPCLEELGMHTLIETREDFRGKHLNAFSHSTFATVPQEDERVVVCPLCRTSFVLDEQGVRGLKSNHYLANIVDKIKGAQSTKMCGTCTQVIVRYISCMTCSFQLSADFESVLFTVKNATCFYATTVITKYTLCDCCFSTTGLLTKIASSA